MSYDAKCLELATHFLKDEPKLDGEETRDALAQLIQDTIERWIKAAKE